VARRGRGRGVGVRAARLHRPRTAEAPEDLRIEDVVTPDPGPGEVLVRVHACGVCASDLHVVQGVTPSGHLPVTLGHEAAGVVAAVGDGVEDWLPGDRVLVPPGRTCGQCAMCLGGRDNLCPFQQVLGVTADGAQADHALALARMLVPVPGSMPFDQAAILADAVATPYHALKRGGINEDTTCAVVGLGGLGMHAIQLARLTGAHVIGVDVDEVALERALAWGAHEVVDASEGGGAAQVRELTEGGVDRSFEFVGLQATAHDAIKCLRPGGRATLVGISRERLSTLPLGLFVAQELEVVGSFGSTLQDVNELLDLVEAGRLDLTRSVSHTLTLDEFPEALRMLETREGHPIRIVVDHG
jgi:D-arabinose 1-dehydrogenase-like Zn-dependent alcohol dehydrogenase